MPRYWLISVFSLLAWGGAAFAQTADQYDQAAKRQQLLQQQLQQQQFQQQQRFDQNNLNYQQRQQADQDLQQQQRLDDLEVQRQQRALDNPSTVIVVPQTYGAQPGYGAPAPAPQTYLLAPVNPAACRAFQPIYNQARQFLGNLCIQ